MSDSEMRIEALRLAKEHASEYASAADIVEIAEVFFRFLIGPERS